MQRRLAWLLCKDDKHRSGFFINSARLPITIAFLAGGLWTRLHDYFSFYGNASSLEKIKVVTYEKGIKNNDFSIFYDEKIIIKGEQYDARNLPKYFNEKSKNNMFSKINTSTPIFISIYYKIP